MGSTSKILVFLENLGNHNSGSIKDRTARLVSIDFSQEVLLAYQILLKSVILSYESLVGFVWFYPYNTLTNCDQAHVAFSTISFKKIDTLNLEFQSEHFRLHQLYFTISIEYKSILNVYKKRCFKLNQLELSDINTRDKKTC